MSTIDIISNAHKIPVKRKEKTLILKKTILALVTIGILVGTGKGSAGVAKEARTVQITESTNTQTYGVNEKVNKSNAPLCVPEPTYELLENTQAALDETEEQTELIHEAYGIKLRLSKMMVSTAPELQSLSISDSEQPAEKMAAPGDGAAAEVSDIKKEYSEKEKEMIAYVVFAEARGEDFDGMVAVAQVVLNRYESGKFGKSVKRVVYARNQFAVSNRYSGICMEAVVYAIENRPYPDNMYYFQVSKRKKWRNFEYYRRIGNHSFYCGKV